MRSKVKVSNLHAGYKLNERFARGVASKALEFLKKEDGAELEFIFVDDEAIKAFNKNYKHENRSTDVLSFKIDRREFGQKMFLGQIIISLDMARDNSEVFGSTITDEIVLYMIHGILHLFGYDDGNTKDSLRMSKKQDLILERLGLCKDLSKVLMPR